MLLFIKGLFKEANATIANQLERAKLDHQTQRRRPGDDFIAPRLYENGELIADGIQPCLQVIEERRQARVITKLHNSPDRAMAHAGAP